MKPVNAVPLDRVSNDKLDTIVEQRQLDSFNRVTKKGVIAELIAKTYKKEIK